MKRIISILICAFVLMTTAAVIAAASDNGVYVYVIDDTEYTVEFSDNSISAEKKELIAQSLVGLTDDSAQTYGLGCTLFGHDYKYTTSAVTIHKAYTSAPRCQRSIYDVTYCEDCDYSEQTLVSIRRIDCCPED